MKIIAARLLVGFLFFVISIGQGMAESRCKDSVAVALSVQGTVEVRPESVWLQVKTGDGFCASDIIRVGENSRALIRLHKEQTNVQIDQNSTLSFGQDESDSWLEFVKGVFHSISRVPRALTIKTPYVNAAVEGTEFLVEVSDATVLTVFEGRMQLRNDAGSLIVTSGQTAIAKYQIQPVLGIPVRPDDAVQWAMHYPPIMEFNSESFAGTVESWFEEVKQAVSLVNQGKFNAALTLLAKIPDHVKNPQLDDFRASLLLSVGRVVQAQKLLDRELGHQPLRSNVLALQSIIAVVKNQKDQALDLALHAVQHGDAGVAAFLALSYAQQALFNLDAALTSATKALQIEPANALAASRVAELHLSMGDVNKALAYSQRATLHAPNLAQVHTLLGFVYLIKIDIDRAKQTFEKAIELDQSAPLPHLGLGLAIIRSGNLQQGREQLEIAASLAPRNALIRSYVAKAYFEEKRYKIAADQYAQAKKMDPNDPTPWFYDAILKQSQNRPIEALQDLQESIKLNDNRAVYRSRLLLDEDLAVRGASLAGIYKELGFEQLALVEGWKSINADPGNYSAHRLLADSYSAIPRHEIARVSELLQAQLLQPLNVSPIQPQSSESHLDILKGSGPDASFNEYMRLFIRDGHSFRTTLSGGSQNSFADDLVVSGLQGKYSYSVGQYHYQTDGFRENNDLQQDIYNGFAQVSINNLSNFQIEIRRSDTKNGDRDLLFDPEFFSSKNRNKRIENLARIGYVQSFSANRQFIFSLHRTDSTTKQDISEIIGETPFGTATREEVNSNLIRGYNAETQYQARKANYNYLIGLGYFSATEENKVDRQEKIGDMVLYSDNKVVDISSDHIISYLYSNIYPFQGLTFTLGLSADLLNYKEAGIELDENQLNPKLGFVWNISDLTIRMAYYRALKRSLVSNQTIEPTQVSGFNQFFDDYLAADSKHLGFGLDYKFSHVLFTSLSVSNRNLETPRFNPITNIQYTEEQKEWNGRLYVYWSINKYFAIGSEAFFEDYSRNPEVFDFRVPNKLRTIQVPVRLSFFSSMGITSNIESTYVSQRIDGDIHENALSQFQVYDLSIGMKFFKQLGSLNLSIKNIFATNFKWHDVDFQSGLSSSNLYIPSRRVVLSASLLL